MDSTEDASRYRPCNYCGEKRALLDSQSVASISKKLPEPLRRQRRVARRILNVAVPEIGLDGTRVVTVIGKLVAAGMPQHVGMGLDA
jgi:hypothetical protein